MMKRKALFTALVGTFIEYYDYALYGFSAGLIATHFFPRNDPTVSLIQTFGVFALGSCAKPLGALIFGRLGDVYGRRVSLRISMLGIAIPTTIIGLVPDYETWGWISPLILLLCRIMQGMLVAGQYDGVVIYMLEHITKKRACFGSSLVGLASMIGIAIASFAATLAQQPHLPDYYWRIPFLLGGVMGSVIFYFRQYLDETPEFKAYKAKLPLPIDANFKRFLSRNGRGLLSTLLVCGAVGGCYHFYIIFWGTYLSTILQILSPNQAAFAMSVSVFTLAFFSPVAGLAADRVGIQKTLTTAALGLILMAILNSIMVWHKIMPLAVMMMTSGVMAFFMVPGHAYLINLYGIGERYRGLSLGHTLGSMIFSGSAPFLSLYIWQKTVWSLAPMVYFMILVGLMPLALAIGRQRLAVKHFSGPLRKHYDWQVERARGIEPPS
jgi:MHS family proline/betaine transporter-like MFS transporter